MQLLLRSLPAFAVTVRRKRLNKGEELMLSGQADIIDWLPQADMIDWPHRLILQC